MGTGAVQVPVDRVPGPVHEVLPEARLLDHVPRGAVHLVALDASAFGAGPAHQVQRGVASIPHRRPDPPHLVRRNRAREAHPGLVGGDRPGIPPEQVDQHDLVLPERPVFPRHRGVVAVRRVGAETDDGWVIGSDPFPLHRLHDPLLELGFPQSLSALTNREPERLPGNSRQHFRGLAVTLGLFGTPGRHEVGHQRLTRHHSAAQRFDQLNHPMRNPVQIGHAIAGGNLHRHGPPPHQLAQSRVQLFPLCVGHHPAGKARQRLKLDLVGHRDRLLSRTEQHEDPAGTQSTEPEHPAGDRIVTLEVEQQPAIGPGPGQSRRQRGVIVAVEPPDHSYPPASVARQKQWSSPSARHRSWIMAPSNPLATRSSSAITAL